MNCSQRKGFARLYIVRKFISKFCVTDAHIPFQNAERPDEFHKAFIDLCTPQVGRVMDFYCGPLSIAVETLQTKQHFISFKSNTSYFNAVPDKLSKFYRHSEELKISIVFVPQNHHQRLLLFRKTRAIQWQAGLCKIHYISSFVNTSIRVGAVHIPSVPPIYWQNEDIWPKMLK